MKEASGVFLLKKGDLVLAVFFRPEDLYFLGDDRIDGAADIVGLDGELAAIAAVDEDAEFDFGGAAEVQQGVESRADGAARPEDVVDEDDLFVRDGEGDIGLVKLVQTGADVVAVEGDV